MIVDFAVAHAIATARLFKQIWCIGHAFHAARNNDFRASCRNEISAQHDCFHA